MERISREKGNKKKDRSSRGEDVEKKDFSKNDKLKGSDDSQEEDSWEEGFSEEVFSKDGDFGDIGSSPSAQEEVSKDKGPSKQSRPRKRGHLLDVLLLVIVLVGVGLLLYPTVSDWWNSMHQTRAIAQYAESVSGLDAETCAELLAEAEAYNEWLYETDHGLGLDDDELEEYSSMLHIEGSNVIGYIEIEKIDCYLPICLGTDEGTLQNAVGHLEGSSLPVGGENTHSVLSGHRGLPSAKLFSDLDVMEVGDTFIVHVLNRTLTYEVDQILTVLPSEVEALAIEEGQDYCTLLTCTPYGVNTHRLLVRGHRIENAVSDWDYSAMLTEAEDPIDYWLRITAIITAILGIAIAGTTIITTFVLKNKGRKK